MNHNAFADLLHYTEVSKEAVKTKVRILKEDDSYIYFTDGITPMKVRK